MGLFLFMANKRYLDKVNAAEIRKLQIALDMKIECPKEYEEFYKRSMQAKKERLEKQLAFLYPKFNGLVETENRLRAAGVKRSKSLVAAREQYQMRVLDLESEYYAAVYPMEMEEKAYAG